MPRYFFHVHDGVDHLDGDGTELADLQAARNHAVRYFGDMLRDNPETAWSGEPWSMNVTTENGLVLFTLYFLGVDAPSTAKAPGPQITQTPI